MSNVGKIVFAGFGILALIGISFGAIDFAEAERGYSAYGGEWFLVAINTVLSCFLGYKILKWF